MKMRIGALIGLLVVVVVVIAIGGYWYVKDRTRIGQASLQTKVAETEGGSKAACVKKDSNAAPSPSPVRPRSASRHTSGRGARS